jgi:hypothetical protein
LSKAWLIGSAAFVGALAVAGVVIALATTRGVELLPSDSPEGTLQRYLMAIEDRDYEEAYSYLSESARATCPYADFVRATADRELHGADMTLEDTERFDERALVTARVTVFEPNVPFGPEEYSYDRTFELKLDGDRWGLTWPERFCGPLY